MEQPLYEAPLKLTLQVPKNQVTIDLHFLTPDAWISLVNYSSGKFLRPKSKGLLSLVANIIREEQQCIETIS